MRNYQLNWHIVSLRSRHFSLVKSLVDLKQVVFILDSSESAKNKLFQQEKNFVLMFSTQLSTLKITGISLKIRMAALQYSSSVSIEHRFVDWKDLDLFHRKINAMSYIGQGTFTSFAINTATQMLLQETHKEAVRIMVLMTDGVDHPRSPDMIVAAEEAKRHNIKIFTVGLSDVSFQRESKEKLQAMASSPAERFVHSMEDPKLQEKLFKEMQIYFCISNLCKFLVNGNAADAEHCTKPCNQTALELVFVIDSSESVGPENFRVIKDLVNAVVDRTTVSRSATRVGVVLYSNINIVVVDLKQEATADDVKSAVNAMNYVGEGTYTGSAIEKANQLFKAARQGVRKVAVIITDGQTDTRDVVSLESAVLKASESQIERFVIGIVNESDPNSDDFKRELNFIASDPDQVYMFLIKDFKTLIGDMFIILCLFFTSSYSLNQLFPNTNMFFLTLNHSKLFLLNSVNINKIFMLGKCQDIRILHNFFPKSEAFMHCPTF
uniref:VWFA domain-containing protein n=1 Tax=Poecilia latipinna TaxID=48699 RepID=A0A3B3U8F3_9TELE